MELLLWNAIPLKIGLQHIFMQRATKWSWNVPMRMKTKFESKSNSTATLWTQYQKSLPFKVWSNLIWIYFTVQCTFRQIPLLLYSNFSIRSLCVRSCMCVRTMSTRKQPTLFKKVLTFFFPFLKLKVAHLALDSTKMGFIHCCNLQDNFPVYVLPPMLGYKIVYHFAINFVSSFTKACTYSC